MSVTNDITIKVMLVLVTMASWIGWVVDVKGVFLHGTFNNNEVIYTEVPKQFEKCYNPNIWMLKLLKTVYGLKQVSILFWRELLEAMRFM